jgi:hypothetical protein
MASILPLFFALSVVQTDEEHRDQEHRNISIFFELFVILLIPLLIFTRSNHFSPTKFTIELTLYTFGYDTFHIINYKESRSFALLIGCVVIMTTIHLIEILHICTHFLMCKEYFNKNKVKHPAINEYYIIDITKVHNRCFLVSYSILLSLVPIATFVPIVSGYIMYNHYVFESVDFLVLHTIASFVPIALFLSYKMNIFNNEIEVGTITLISVTFSLSHAAILVFHDALYLKAIGFLIFRNIRCVIYENKFKETLLNSNYED